MPAATTLAWIGVGIAGVGAVQSHQARQEAKGQLMLQGEELKSQGAEKRKQFESQQRIADIKNARERAEFVRKAFFARAQVINQGALTGTSQSSGVAGGLATIDTQAASGLGGFEAMQANQSDIFQSQDREAGSIVRAGVAGAAITKAGFDIQSGQAVQSLGSDIFGAGGGWKTIFGKK